MDETSHRHRFSSSIRPSSSPPVSDNGGARSSRSLEPFAAPEIPDRTTRLLLLSYDGDSDAVAALIANGVDVDVADSDNRTALHVASCMGHANVVDLLIRLGANVNVQDRWRSTPLSDARHYGQKKVCKQLENAGANIPAENPSDIGSCSENSADKLINKAMLEDNVISSPDIDRQSSNLPSEPTEEEVSPGGFLHSSVKDVNLYKDLAAKEVEMLELCLHAPLVSIRVGKIQRQGRFLCPTNSRGYLNLKMLPSSDLRLIFMADDGVIEKITDIRTVDMSTHVTLDMLDPDPSGRSFILRVSDGGTYFFWQSERSRILGHELLSDMKFLLSQRPTLSRLTGVDDSRLDNFVNNFEAATLNDFNICMPLGITSYSQQAVGNRSITQQFIGKEVIHNCTDMPAISSRTKQSATFISTLHGGSEYDCVSNTLPINSCVAVCLSKEETVEQRTGAVGLSGVPSYVPDLQRLLSNDDPFSRRVINLPGISPTLSSASNLLPSLIGVSFDSSCSHLPIHHSPIAPYYCPCPLSSSSFQYAIAPPCLTSVRDTISLSSSFLTVKPSAAQVSFSLDRVNVSPIPAPGSSLLTIPTPLQASSLPSSFSDPIVHIPVIDFQSANQTFLVSMPQAISACGISPVVPNFLGNIIPNGEQSLRQGFPAVNVSQFSRSDEDRDTGEMHLFFINNRLRSLLSSCTHNFSKKDGVEQAADGSWCSRLENIRSSVVDSILQCSGPSVGMVPTVLSSGGLSCACNFCPEISTQPSPWVSGSRGLYGASCEPGLSSASIASFSPSLGMSIIGADIFNIPKNKGILADTVNTADLSSHSINRDDNAPEKGKEDM